MKAAYYVGKETITLCETDIPKINDDQILIKVKAASLCGTDLKIFRGGHFKIKEDEKRILCHEISGEIKEVGKDVKEYKLGERVMIVPNYGCMECDYCKAGYNNLCNDYEAFGVSIDGGLSEYMLIPKEAIKAKNIVKISDKISYVDAALAEPLSCAYNAFKDLNIKKNDTALIIGPGPIGALHILLLKSVGAKVIMAGRNNDRLKIAKDIGADLTINNKENNLYEELMKHTNNKGADVVILACSSPTLQSESLNLAAKNGRISFFGGLKKSDEYVTLNTNLIHYKQLKILGHTGSTIKDVKDSLKLIEDKKIDLSKIVGKIFSIDEINDAFKYIIDANNMKALIVYEE